MAEADTSSSHCQDKSSSENNHSTKLRRSLYEYTFFTLFSRYRNRKNRTEFIEKLDFNLSLLKIESIWKVEKLDGNDRLGVYSVRRRLNFLPFKETINNWSITINMSDVMVGVYTAEQTRKKIFAPFQEFKNLVVTREKPYIEFEYEYKETEQTTLFTRFKGDYWCDINISVVNCNGLESYIGQSIDFTSSFDGSNVILELDDGQRLYFLFELLAVNSCIFYDKWLGRKNLPKEGDHYLIPMNDTDIDGLALILKMIAYKRDCIQATCVETVALMAKEWKFEMILAACEDFFIKHVDKNIYRYNHLAQRYDMCQLQNILLAKCDVLSEKLYALENQLAGVHAEQRVAKKLPKVSSETLFLEQISAEKFSLPEIGTTFQAVGDLNFKKSSKENFILKAFLDWGLQFKYNENGVIDLTISPKFPFNSVDQKVFSSFNWSVEAVFTVTFNGKEKKFEGSVNPRKREVCFKLEAPVINADDTRIETGDSASLGTPDLAAPSSNNVGTSNPRKRKIHYTIEELSNGEGIRFPVSIKAEIKYIRGLRFFANDWRLRPFCKKCPTSDIVLKCKDRKLFANLNILSRCSTFFKGMKEHLEMVTIDEDEKLPTVIMDDIHSAVMMWILNYAYSISRAPLDVDQLENIIPVADRFLFGSLIHHCERQLMSTSNYPLGLKTLDFAIKHRLYALKDSYINHFQSTAQIQKLKDDPSYKDLSEAAKMLLYERIMSLPVVE